MSTLMPLASPTMTDGSIGRIKSDTIPPTDLDREIPAEEYNQFRREFIAACDAIRGMMPNSTTLQAAYTNGGTAVIVLDNVRHAVKIKDTASAQVDGIFEAARNDGTRLFNVADDNIDIGTSVVQPTTDGVTDLGTASKAFRTLFANRFRFRRVAAAGTAAAPVCDARRGSWFTLALTADVTSMEVTNAVDGQLLIFEVYQPGAGGPYNTVALNESNVTPIYVSGERPIRFSQVADATDLFVFMYSSRLGALIEVARRQAAPPPDEILTRALNLPVQAAATIYLDGHRRVFCWDALQAARTVDLTLRNNYVDGSEVHFFFSGVVIPNDSHLRIRTAGGTTLVDLNNVSLTSNKVAVYNGARSLWELY